MDEHRQHEQDTDEEPRENLKLPEERVEDLEPDDQDSARVQGGYSFKQGFPTKWP